MRHIFRKTNKSLIIFVTFAFALLFASLITAFPKVFADDEESFVIEDADTSHIVIYDSNKKFSIRSDAETVGEVLERANIELNEFDSVSPSLDSLVNADIFFINIYRAHPALVIDGALRKFVMTSSFDKKVIVEQAGLPVYDGDKISVVPNTQFFELGIASVYEITRGDGATLTVTEEIPFPEESYKDYELGSGKSEVIQLGEVGRKTLVYSIKTKNGVETSRELISETIIREPVARITRIGADPIEMHPLTVSMGRNRYTVQKSDGTFVERQETYYDLDMSRVVTTCGKTSYSVRADGAKVDDEGYVLVAANLSRYPRCSVVQTSLGAGKVYDTGGFAASNPEQFDLATDWSDRNGR